MLYSIIPTPDPNRQAKLRETNRDNRSGHFTVHVRSFIAKRTKCITRKLKVHEINFYIIMKTKCNMETELESTLELKQKR